MKLKRKIANEKQKIIKIRTQKKTTTAATIIMTDSLSVSHNNKKIL